MSGQLFQQVCDNTANKHGTHKYSLCIPKHISWYTQTFILHTKAYHMVHTNIRCAYQGISHGTYKHLLCIPRYITWYIQTFVVHTKAYCIAHMKHSYCTPVYKTQLSFESCCLCIRFHIVCSFDTSEAHSTWARRT